MIAVSSVPMALADCEPKRFRSIDNDSLCWRALSEDVVIVADTTQDEHERILLLLPAVGLDNELPPDAAEVLAQALASCSAVDAPEPLAAMLVAMCGD